MRVVNTPTQAVDAGGEIFSLPRTRMRSVGQHAVRQIKTRFNVRYWPLAAKTKSTIASTGMSALCAKADIHSLGYGSAGNDLKQSLKYLR